MLEHHTSPNYGKGRRSNRHARTVRFAIPTITDCSAESTWSPQPGSTSGRTYTQRRSLSEPSSLSQSTDLYSWDTSQATIGQDTTYSTDESWQSTNRERLPSYKTLRGAVKQLSNVILPSYFKNRSSFETSNASSSEPWNSSGASKYTTASSSTNSSKESQLSGWTNGVSRGPMTCLLSLGVLAVIIMALFVFRSYHAGRHELLALTITRSIISDSRQEELNTGRISVKRTRRSSVLRKSGHFSAIQKPTVRSSSMAFSLRPRGDGHIVGHVVTPEDRRRKKAIVWEGMKLYPERDASGVELGATTPVNIANSARDRAATNGSAKQRTTVRGRGKSSVPSRSAAKITNIGWCETKVCEEESVYITKYLNWSTNPCSDFYGFVCGRWKQLHPEIGTSLDSLLVKKMEEIIYHTLMAKEGHASQMRLLGQIIDTCVHNPFLDEPRSSLLNYMSSLGLQGWPFVTRSHTNIWKPAGLMIRHLGLSTLLSVNVEVDPDVESRYIIALGEPSLLIGQYEAKNSTLPQWYHMAITSCFKVFTSGKYVDIPKRVLDFSSKLADISVNRGDESFGGKWYKAVQLRHYRSFIPLLTVVFNNITVVHGQTKVIVKSESYIRSLSSALHLSRPIDVLNYLGFRALLHISPLLPEQAADLASVQMREITGYIRPSWPRWRRCLRVFERVAPHVFQQTYAQTTQGHVVNQDKTWALLNEIQAGFILNINNAPWISVADKELLKRRLAKIKLNVFYRSWTDPPDDLSAPCTHGKHGVILMYHTMAKHFVEKELSRVTMSRRVQEPEWKGSVFDTEPLFDKESNSVFVPMAMFDPAYLVDSDLMLLQVPHIAAKLIGALFQGVHEQNFPPAKLKWSADTRMAYRDLQICLEKQYEMLSAGRIRNLIAPEWSVVDSMALLPALKLYLKKVNQVNIEGLLGGNNITAKQLFFIAYAKGICETAELAWERQVVGQSTRGVSYLRVNGVIRNSFRFPTFWSCGSDTLMNPSEKCTTWTS